MIPYDPTREALYTPEKQKPAFPPGLDWTIDRICAELSRKAYFHFEKPGDDGTAPEKQRLIAELATIGFADVQGFARDEWSIGAQAFGTVSPEHGVVVAFRGTQWNEPFDGLTDIWAWLLPWEKGRAGRVHRGFWRQLRSILDQIDAWLAPRSHLPLCFTGHSLGAALATLMAARYAGSRLITFGSPEVGTRAFGASIDPAKVRRYVDCTDLVTMVPFWWPYRAVGEMIFIDSEGALHEQPDATLVSENRRQALRAYRERYGDRPNHVLVRNLADHAPINYVSAVLGLRAPDPD